jgi:hypothetical protein
MDIPTPRADWEEKEWLLTEAAREVRGSRPLLIPHLPFFHFMCKPTIWLDFAR